MRLIDTHAHLTDDRFAGDLPDVLQRAQEAGLCAVINAGFDLASSQRAVALAASVPMVYAAVGIHPHEASAMDIHVLEEIRRLAGSGKVVAVGEIGLDYYYNHAPRQRQQETLRAQLGLARELKLPVIVHDREAHGDILSILQEEPPGSLAGVMHCFSGDRAFAARCLELGLYISIAGPVTFKKASELADVAAYVPADRLLLETDAPYLAPVPYRGRRNEPAYVMAVAQQVAQIRQVGTEELAAMTTANAIRLFGLDIGPS
jgi:TatD DNase family protein